MEIGLLYFFQKEIETYVFLFDPSLMYHTHQKAATPKIILLSLHKWRVFDVQNVQAYQIVLLYLIDTIKNISKSILSLFYVRTKHQQKSFRLSILVSTKSAYIRPSEIRNSWTRVSLYRGNVPSNIQWYLESRYLFRGIAPNSSRLIRRSGRAAVTDRETRTGEEKASSRNCIALKLSSNEVKVPWTAGINYYRATSTDEERAADRCGRNFPQVRIIETVIYTIASDVASRTDLSRHFVSICL